MLSKKELRDLWKINDRGNHVGSIYIDKDRFCKLFKCNDIEKVTPVKSAYRTALLFKKVLGLVLNRSQWLPDRKDPYGGFWVHCDTDLTKNECYSLVKATVEESATIDKLWADFEIGTDGYIVVDGEEVPMPIPPTKVLVALLQQY